MISKETPNKRYLAIDTSTAMLTVAVVEGTRVLKEISSSAERNHSLYLIPTVKEVLQSLNMHEQDLDGIIVGRGPGSYTGVRIGVTVGKTLAWVWKKPIVGVSSLEGLALAGWHHATQSLMETSGNMDTMLPITAVNFRDQQEDTMQSMNWIVPLIDARRGQVYTSLWFGQATVDSIQWEGVQEDRVRLMRDWVDQIVESTIEHGTPAHIWVIGDVELHLAEVERLQSLISAPVHMVSYTMEARWLGLTGGNRLMRGDFDDAHRFEPNYTQLAEAEAKLLAKS
ncbi:tRNA (adenosine(37)-N6)-threonylcarbamoyltransferase complex dimerization subunit type 1 TsaB [Paenibacillus guangzhouensis]|uniref:tRNA (adenosine(37)-N6)-threonylcarbamoyltransferase complex dimerization subunit type 1 TsaB n=1 Tax=Paenibacillus guangzhouensis TaxID=1473112 RepID=UPI00126772E3|nr:tRNA (adenosine(37)-N6)-threonylcarbamoyltransferase complex dimerization subunit type 1 TsaB [Paenibacillus guangzhouensis]